MSGVGWQPNMYGAHKWDDLFTWAEGPQVEYYGPNNITSDDEKPKPMESNNAASSSARGDAVQRADSAPFR